MWLREMFIDMLGYATWMQPPALKDLLGYAYFLFDYSKPVLFVAALGSLLAIWQDGRRLLKGPGRGWVAFLLNPTVVLVVWLIGPVLIAFVKSLVSIPVFIYRNLMISLPPAYLLLARGLSLLPVRRLWRFAAVGALTVALVAFLIVDMDYYQKPTKQQFREVVQYVVERDSSVPDAAILGYAWTEEHFNYYFRRLGSTRRVGQVLGEPSDIPQLESYLAREQPAHLWYIVAHKIPKADFLAALSSKMKLVEYEKFIAAEVWLWAAP